MLHLRARHGAAGYGVYIMLLNFISESPSRTIDADTAYLAYVMRVDEALVKSVLLDFGLFTISADGRTASSPLVEQPQETTATTQATQGVADAHPYGKAISLSPSLREGSRVEGCREGPPIGVSVAQPPSQRARVYRIDTPSP